MKNWWWYQTYLLQLENYDLYRYFRLLLKRGWFPERNFTQRLGLEKTLKLYLILGLAFGFGFGSVVYNLTNISTLVLIGFVYALLWPLVLALFVILITPADWFIKEFILLLAKNKLKHGNLKVIAVVGSYGKTTVKEAVAAALGGSEVLCTPDNLNTPLGIARLIRGSDLKKYKYLVAEVGEYYPGDIAKLIKFLNPSAVVITGINEAHQERFKSMNSTIKSIFEGATASANETILFLNHDDVRIGENYLKYVRDKKFFWYGIENGKYKISKQHFLTDGTGIEFELQAPNGEMTKTKTKLLGSYALGLYVLGVEIAEWFGKNLAGALNGLKSLEPIKHRLQPIAGKNGILVIDDSYNGSPEGVSAALEVLTKFAPRRRVYLTPGLVELGAESDKIHLDIGRKLSSAADLVILIKNSATPFVERGLIDQGFAKEAIVWFNSAQLAHQNLDKILQPNDVILFQNDWGDNYV